MFLNVHKHHLINVRLDNIDPMHVGKTFVERNERRINF